MTEVVEEDRPKIPSPIVDHKNEVQEFAQRLGSDYIYPGIEFGTNYPLDETVAAERARAARQRFLGVEIEKIKEAE